MSRNKAQNDAQQIPKVYIKDMNIDVPSYGIACEASVTIVLPRIPTSREDMLLLLCNEYLESKGIPDSIDTIIEKKYPEYII